jgi:hypothetical protein
VLRHSAQELGRMGGPLQLEDRKGAIRRSSQAPRLHLLLVCCRITSASGRLATAAPAPHASPAAAGGPPIDPMALMTPDLIQAREALQLETGR